MASPLPRWKQWIAKYRPKHVPKTNTKPKPIVNSRSTSRSVMSKSFQPVRSRSRTLSRSMSSSIVAEKILLSRAQAERMIFDILDVERGDPNRITQMLTILGDLRIKPTQIKYLEESVFQELVKVLRVKMKLFKNTQIKPRTVALPASVARASAVDRPAPVPVSDLNRTRILDRISASLHPTMGADPNTQVKVIAVLRRHKLSLTQLRTLSDVQLGALASEINQQTRLFR